MKMNGKSSRLYKWAVACIMACGAAVACYGITYNEPRYLSDFYFRIPLNMMVNRMEPGFYKHPSLMYDLIAVFYWLYFQVMKLTGQTKYVVDLFMDYYFYKPAVFYALGRSVSVLSFVGVIGITARIGRRLWDPRVGLLSAFLVMSSYAVLEYSHAQNVDMLALFLILVVFDTTVSAVERHTLGRYAAAGAALGLAVSANYPAAASGIFIAWAFFTGIRGRALRIGTAFAAVTAAVSAAAVLFTATSPYSILAMKDFMNDVLFQSQSISQSSEGREIRNTYYYYFDYIFKSGGVIISLGIPGMMWAAAKGKSGERMAAAFVIVVIGFFQMIATKESRWVMPVIPLLALFSARFIFHAAKWIHLKPLRAALLAAIIVNCLTNGVVRQVRDNWLNLNRPDTRLMASQWLLEHASAGEKVFYETNTIYYRSPNEQKRTFKGFISIRESPMNDRFFYYSYIAFDKASRLMPDSNITFTPYHLSSEDTIGNDAFYDPVYIMSMNAEWIVLNNEMIRDIKKLHKINQNKYARILNFYKWVGLEYTEVKRFDSRIAQGSGIIIYRRKHEFDIKNDKLPDVLKTNENASELYTEKPGRVIRICLMPVCESLAKEIRRDRRFPGAVIYHTQTKEGYRILIDLPVKGRKEMFRVSVLRNPAANVPCYMKYNGFCVQHYNRTRLDGKEESAIGGVGKILSRWRGGEWPE